MAVQFANCLSQTCLRCRNETDWLWKIFSQCHCTVNFWLQVPENTHNLKDQCN